jgi:L,D-transpeptidase catalytic domain
VPDDALAKLYGCDTTEVAHRRAAAIERLADDLGVQRGEELGAVLKALLEAETWEAAEGPRPMPGSVEAAPTANDAPPGRPGAASPMPVLEMLGEADEGDERPRRKGSRQLAAAGILAGALLVAAGVVAAATFVDDRTGGLDGRRPRSETRPFLPQKSGPLGNPFPSDAKSASDYATAYVPRAATLYDAPGGTRMLTISGRTEWRSPRILGVVEQRGRWLGVEAPELKNGEVGWIPQDKAQVGAVRYRIDADLSRHRLWVNRDGHAVRRTSIAVGAGAHPTPTGRFSVTDKLRVTNGGSPYGCCVLALSGHQTRLPREWPGGDRLAIHATTDTSSIGKDVSLGCMRVNSHEARWLLETIPLGTPVFIRR